MSAVKNKLIKVGIIQMSCSADVNANMEKAVSGIRDAASKGAAIVCLQELFSSLYFCNVENYDNFDLSEPVPGPKTEIFQKLAADLKVVIVASLFEKLDEGLFFNTAAVIDSDGTFLGKYRKNHIPDDPGFYEKFYFTPGDTGYKVFDTAVAKIGVLVCWDQWYPEAARITSMMGADMLIYPTAIGWSVLQTDDVNGEQFEAWQTIQRSHAIANGIHVIAVNRTGIEDKVRFWGGSFIAGPFGQVLYQAPMEKEETAVVGIDLSQKGFYRKHWPFMRDRRIDTYGSITKRYLDNGQK